MTAPARTASDLLPRYKWFMDGDARTQLPRRTQLTDPPDYRALLHDLVLEFDRQNNRTGKLGLEWAPLRRARRALGMGR